MRLATTASIALLALSSAALAQVASMPQNRTGNMTMNNASGPGNSPMSMPNDSVMADNMMDNSSNPPPDEPK